MENQFVNVRDLYNLITEIVDKEITKAKFDKKYQAFIASTPLNGFADIKLTENGTIIPQVKMRVGTNIQYGDEVYVVAVNNSLTNLFIDAKKNWNANDILEYKQINDYDKDICLLVSPTGNDNNDGRFLRLNRGTMVPSDADWSKIIGTGTFFTEDLIVGGYVMSATIGGTGYFSKILSIEDNTHLTLVNPINYASDYLFSPDSYYNQLTYCAAPKRTVNSTLASIPKKNGYIIIFCDDGNYESDNEIYVNNFTGKAINIFGRSNLLAPLFPTYLPNINIQDNSCIIGIGNATFREGGEVVMGSSSMYVGIRIANSYARIMSCNIISTLAFSIPGNHTELYSGIVSETRGQANLISVNFTNSIGNLQGVTSTFGGQSLVINSTGATQNAYAANQGGSLYYYGTMPTASGSLTSATQGGLIVKASGGYVGT